MPNRFLKESICTSTNIDALSPGAEVLWYRLLVQCDDFGRFDGRPCVIRARCFPLRLERISDRDIIGWMNELIAADLVWFYYADDELVIQVTKWHKHQQQRATKSKYPDPPADAADGKQLLADDINCNQMSPYSNLESRISYIDIDSSAREKTAPSGADAPSSKPTKTPKPQPPYSEDQQRFLEMFSAKRFANYTQSGAITALVNAYPTTFWEAADWAAEKGMTLGDAVTNIKRALPKWGQPKPGKAGSNGNHQRDGNTVREVDEGSTLPAAMRSLLGEADRR